MNLPPDACWEGAPRRASVTSSCSHGHESVPDSPRNQLSASGTPKDIGGDELQNRARPQNCAAVFCEDSA